MGELLVVTGPPGAGKSTVTPLLAAGYPLSALVAADTMFGFLAGGYRDPWLPEADEQNTVVVEAAALAAGRFVRGGYQVVYDGAVGPWFLPTFLASAGLSRLHLAVLLPSEETCVQRVRDRPGHGFTDLDATRDMHRWFTGGDLDPRHVIAGVRPPGEIAAEVRKRADAGELAYPRG